MSISLPKTLTKLQKATCSKWSERLHQDKMSGESRYKEDTAGENATLATQCLHSTLLDDAVHCLKDPGFPAGPPDDAADELPAEATLLTSTHLGQNRWMQHMVPSETVEILALLQDALSALLS